MLQENLAGLELLFAVEDALFSELLSYVSETHLVDLLGQELLLIAVDLGFELRLSVFMGGRSPFFDGGF